jgi:hypothetical protein
MNSKETIGTRMYSECLRLWGSIYRATKELGVSQPMIIYRWGRGISCPQAYYLAQILKAGADIHYILTGVKQCELS